MAAKQLAVMVQYLSRRSAPGLAKAGSRMLQNLLLLHPWQLLHSARDDSPKFHHTGAENMPQALKLFRAAVVTSTYPHHGKISCLNHEMRHLLTCMSKDKELTEVRAYFGSYAEQYSNAFRTFCLLPAWETAGIGSPQDSCCSFEEATNLVSPIEKI